MPEPKIAAVYIRVSTDDQTELSPDSQLEVLRAWAEKNGCVIPDQYIFREEEGISGRKAEKRPRFIEMIATAKGQDPPFQITKNPAFRPGNRSQREIFCRKWY